MTFLVDSHCHLNSLVLPSKQADNLDEVMARAAKTGVTHMLCVACTPAEFQTMQECIRPYEGVYSACGVHPLNLEECQDWTEEELLSCLTAHDKVLALGETGLDYHYAPESRKAQLDSFARQIALALQVKKPLVIHAREAKQDCLALMRSENARDAGGVMHCFCDDVDMARQCLDMGFYVSFSGIVTFRAGENVREVARYVPLDRMLVETDCPYLAPVPVRGHDNEPAYVRYTLECVAELKGVPAKVLAERTSQNFSDLFRVQLTEHAPWPQECRTGKIEKAMRPL